MIKNLNSNLLDLVVADEKVIMKQTIMMKSGFQEFPRTILLTNQKFVYGDDSYSTSIFPLKNITYISLEDSVATELGRKNFAIHINDTKVYISRKQEAIAKEIFINIVKNIHC
ncbi:MAG: hypothetical protein J6A83_02175 [Clostridia bacterium]|nr:hypothetical protein [Clostridia bacterium]